MVRTALSHYLIAPAQKLRIEAAIVFISAVGGLVVKWGPLLEKIIFAFWGLYRPHKLYRGLISPMGSDSICSGPVCPSRATLGSYRACGSVKGFSLPQMNSPALSTLATSLWGSTDHKFEKTDSMSTPFCFNDDRNSLIQGVKCWRIPSDFASHPSSQDYPALKLLCMTCSCCPFCYLMLAHRSRWNCLVGTWTLRAAFGSNSTTAFDRCLYVMCRSGFSQKRQIFKKIALIVGQFWKNPVFDLNSNRVIPNITVLSRMAQTSGDVAQLVEQPTFNR